MIKTSSHATYRSAPLYSWESRFEPIDFGCSRGVLEGVCVLVVGGGGGSGRRSRESVNNSVVFKTQGISVMASIPQQKGWM